MEKKMKYKINTEVEFKANSLGTGKIVDYEENTSMYSVEILSSGNTIRCTEHYIRNVAQENSKTITTRDIPRRPWENVGVLYITEP